MDACRLLSCRTRWVIALAIASGAGVGYAAEPPGAIRLPAWIEADGSVEATTASFESAPKPRLAPRSYAKPTEIEPPPREPRELAGVQATEAVRLVRQLENAADGARTPHAFGRLLRRYEDARPRVKASDDPALLTRIDRLGGWAYESRGRLRSSAGDHDAATADFRNALVVDRHNTTARHALAVALAEAGQADEALEALSLVLMAKPNSVAARRNRAQLHLGRGRPDSAVADLDVALAQPIQSAEEQAGILRLRGVALHAAGRLRAAATDLNEAIRLDPRDATAYTARGHVFAEGGFYEQAVKDYTTALHTDPGYTDAYRSLAWLLATCPEARLRDPKTAVEAAWRARRLLGYEDFLTLDAAAAAHAAAGDYAEAVRLQQRALVATEAPPRDANARLSLYQAGRPYVAK